MWNWNWNENSSSTASAAAHQQCERIESDCHSIHRFLSISPHIRDSLLFEVDIYFICNTKKSQKYRFLNSIWMEWNGMETNSSHIDTSVYNPIIWCNIPDCFHARGMCERVYVFRFELVIERYSKTVCNSSISLCCKRCDLLRFVLYVRQPASFFHSFIHFGFGYLFFFGLSWDINNSLNNIQMSIRSIFPEISA